jgi:thioredoxin 1
METQTTDRRFSELIKGTKPILVDFFAEWCGPCKMMAPILQDVKKQLGEDVTIIKIDVDKNPQAAAAYQVQGVPTLIVFKEGEVKWRQSGVVAAKQLTNVIEKISSQ